MPSSADLIMARLNRVPDVARTVGIFTSFSGGLANVNIGDRSVALPCVGFTPPTEGMAVQLERRDGQLILTGPAAPLNSLGTLTATGSPLATVTIDSVAYLLPYLSSYTPVLNDKVVVDWTAGVIQGKVSTTPTSVAPPAVQNDPAPKPPLDPGTPVLAIDSGQFYIPNGNWPTNGPRATDTSNGAWFYGSRVRDYLSGSSPTGIAIYLPLLQQLGIANIGVHAYGSKPRGWTGISLSTAMGARSGWVSLPVSFAEYLRDNVGGIAVTSGNGLNRWNGVQADAYSGALRFTGTR